MQSETPSTNSIHMDVPRCGAKLRNKNARCTRIPMKNGRCRLHGGVSPKGIASGQFKTGRYSKYLPKDLNSKFQEAIKDPTLLELGAEIGLVQSMLEERIQKLYSGESVEFWEQARESFRELESAMDDGDEVGVMKLRAAHLKTLQDGLRTSEAYESVQPLVEQRRKLAESENKRLKDLRATITMQQAMGIITLLTSIVKTHVTDQKVLAAISEDLARTITIPAE
jgi:uncharacterized protein YjcR